MPTERNGECVSQRFIALCVGTEALVEAVAR